MHNFNKGLGGLADLKRLICLLLKGITNLFKIPELFFFARLLLLLLIILDIAILFWNPPWRSRVAPLIFKVVLSDSWIVARCRVVLSDSWMVCRWIVFWFMVFPALFTSRVSWLREAKQNLKLFKFFSSFSRPAYFISFLKLLLRNSLGSFDFKLAEYN